MIAKLKDCQLVHLTFVVRKLTISIVFGLDPESNALFAALHMFWTERQGFAIGH